MIDFNNASFFKLKLTGNEVYAPLVVPMFVEGESIIGTFQGIRDGIVFTNKRIIAINAQGLSGKKKDFSSLPYSKIQAYSVETAGPLDLDCEVELWFSGLGKVRLEFSADTNVYEICRFISENVL